MRELPKQIASRRQGKRILEQRNMLIQEPWRNCDGHSGMLQAGCQCGIADTGCKGKPRCDCGDYAPA